MAARALQRVGRADRAPRVAARGCVPKRLHLARALAHERIDELRDEPARSALLRGSRRWRVTSPDGVGRLDAQRHSCSAARADCRQISDELLRRQIGRRTPPSDPACAAPNREPHSHTRGRRAHQVATIAIEIAEPEVRRAPANRPDTARGAATAAPRRCAGGARRHAEQQMRAWLQVVDLQHAWRPAPPPRQTGRGGRSNPPSRSSAGTNVGHDRTRADSAASAPSQSPARKADRQESYCAAAYQRPYPEPVSGRKVRPSAPAARPSDVGGPYGSRMPGRAPRGRIRRTPATTIRRVRAADSRLA